jgi:hypothetical protein
VFPAVIDEPTLYGVAGFFPSKPNCRGTINFLCCIAEFVNDIFVELLAKVDTPRSVPASSLPKTSSKLIDTLAPLVAVDGIGDK